MGKVWNGKPQGYVEVYSSEEVGLKPCPFCGGIDCWLVRAFSAKSIYAVVCNDCGIDAMFYGAEHDKRKMVEKWNREPEENEINGGER